MSIQLRIKELRENHNLSKKDYAFIIKVDNSQYSKIEQGKLTPTIQHIMEICSNFNINADWLLTGKGEMMKSISETNNEIQSKDSYIETRPRVPMDAAAGSLSIAADGVRMEDMEQIPVIKAFSKYDFTIFARGDSMESEIHSGDELACLLIRNATFIQWGRMHVLDTSQGIIVKKIFDKEEYILCRSEESELYPDFMIHKSEIHNIALVIGLVRRY